jgi:hypothetical protein
VGCRLHYTNPLPTRPRPYSKSGQVTRAIGPTRFAQNIAPHPASEQRALTRVTFVKQIRARVKQND